jgi:adenosylcobinamide kinase / adenosylcobinamide-phosphate guanylyltransferase
MKRGRFKGQVNMARIILITGGGRSGKSGYAQHIAESIPGDRTYIATCPVIDAEMEERIRKHKEDRSAGNWQTIEETTDLAAALTAAKESRTILIDCLTLWINNLMYEAAQCKEDLSEEDIAKKCGNVIEVCEMIPGTVIFVTNEVGMGIIPDNALSRRYRDLAGRCNQVMAGRADVVTFMVSGIPIYIKGDKIKYESARIDHQKD